jgi:hypothetical protein
MKADTISNTEPAAARASTEENPGLAFATLSSEKENANHQNNPTDLVQLTRSLHIRPTRLVKSQPDRGSRLVRLLTLAFPYRIHGTGAVRIATPLQTLCVTATAFLPKLFEHQPSISQILFQHYYLVV